MNKLEDLIQKYCPNGVERKALWEVTYWDKNFKGVDKSMQSHVIKYPYLLANELDTLVCADGDIRILYTTENVAYTTKELAGNNLCSGEIVAIPWGGNPTVKYYKGDFVTGDNRIATSSDTRILSNKYLYYWLLQNLDELAGYYRGAGIQHPSMLSVLSMRIPLPPLPVQEEIVRMLDAMSELQENLEKELEERRKQFAYYRDKLMNFNDLTTPPSYRVEWKQLVSVANVLYGCPFDAKLFTDEDSFVPLIRIRDVLSGTPSTYYKGTYEQKYIIRKGDMLVGMDGNFNLGRWKDRDGVLCQRTCKIEANEQHLVLNNYLFYYLGPIFKHIEENTSGGSVKHLSAAAINNISIPLPPLAVQEEITEKLDKMEELINNIESELTERKRQYEHYREQLLSSL